MSKSSQSLWILFVLGLLALIVFSQAQEETLGVSNLSSDVDTSTLSETIPLSAKTSTSDAHVTQEAIGQGDTSVMQTDSESQPEEDQEEDDGEDYDEGADEAEDDGEESDGEDDEGEEDEGEDEVEDEGEDDGEYQEGEESEEPQEEQPVSEEGASSLGSSFVNTLSSAVNYVFGW